jgi:RNA polymerase sigma-70 factor (ECF subfamily)
MAASRPFPSVIALQDSVANVDEARARAIDYVALRRDIARAVGRLCPNWMADRRDDLVQTALLRVMHIVEANSPGEGNPAASTSYLYKVAYSVLVDELRRQRRRRETGLDEDVVPVPRAREDPERTAAARQIGRGIRGCLRAMKQERRLAVTLHLQGHTVPEAARLLDWAFKRTENLVYRGLSDLRACLKAKGIRP